jgi:hypothetical protein
MPSTVRPTRRCVVKRTPSRGSDVLRSSSTLAGRLVLLATLRVEGQARLSHSRPLTVKVAVGTAVRVWSGAKTQPPASCVSSRHPVCPVSSASTAPACRRRLVVPAVLVLAGLLGHQHLGGVVAATSTSSCMARPRGVTASTE